MTTQQYQPGDVANGHVLTADGVWQPIGASPQPPAPRKKGGAWKWIGGGVVALFVIGAVMGGGDEEPVKTEDASATTAVEGEAASAPAEKEKKEKPDPAPKPDNGFDIAVDARTLIDAFDNNELAADAKYAGKTLKVTGVVTGIDTELLNDEKYVLNLTDGDEWAILSVSVHDMPTEVLATIEVGQTISVIAEFDDGGDLGVTLKDGRLA